MATFYLLRHGAIDRSQSNCFIGRTDVPLGDEGRRQAGAWRRFFSVAQPDAVWSSDLKRAAETAEIIFADRADEIIACRAMREIDLGRWEGMPRVKVKTHHPDLWRARGDDLAGFRPPGGESFSDLQQRAVCQLDRIAAQTAGTVCVVTHAGVIRALICHFLQVPLANLFRIHLDYGSLSIVVKSPERVEVCALNHPPPGVDPFPGSRDRRPA